MKASKSPYQLFSYRVERFSFKLNNELDVNRNMPFPVYDLDFSLTERNSDGASVVTLGVKMTEDLNPNIPYYFEFVISAPFVATPDEMNNEDFYNFCLNAAPLHLLSFARSIISSSTSLYGIKSHILPLMDLVKTLDLDKIKHKDIFKKYGVKKAGQVKPHKMSKKK